MRSAVQVSPDPPYRGAIAQLGERLPCTQEVCGSIPHSSTIKDGKVFKGEIKVFNYLFFRLFLLFKKAAK